jgi:hypothetical protein
MAGKFNLNAFMRAPIDFGIEAANCGYSKKASTSTNGNVATKFVTRTYIICNNGGTTSKTVKVSQNMS